jgi:hypothetical protein
VEVLAPAPPTGASNNARCGAGTVTFSATVPAGVTIDWYTTATGGTLVSGGGSVTSFSPTINASTTYYAEARHINAGCVSAARLAVGAYVGTPATSEQPVDPVCGCATGLSNCNGLCRPCCGTLPCPGFSSVTCGIDWGYVNWFAADEICTTYGDGWRLPTRDELVCLCNNLDALHGHSYELEYYWTSEWKDGRWMVSLNACSIRTDGNADLHRVTCVK